MNFEIVHNHDHTADKSKKPVKETAMSFETRKALGFGNAEAIEILLAGGDDEIQADNFRCDADTTGAFSQFQVLRRMRNR